MKCICGYYYLTEKEILEEDIIFQDETREKNGDKVFIKIRTDLFACPICGTVQYIGEHRI